MGATAEGDSVCSGDAAAAAAGDDDDDEYNDEDDEDGTVPFPSIGIHC